MWTPVTSLWNRWELGLGKPHILHPHFQAGHGSAMQQELLWPAWFCYHTLGIQISHLGALGAGLPRGSSAEPVHLPLPGPPAWSLLTLQPFWFDAPVPMQVPVLQRLTHFLTFLVDGSPSKLITGKSKFTGDRRALKLQTRIVCIHTGWLKQARKALPQHFQ